jgi:hypothetical protein
MQGGRAPARPPSPPPDPSDFLDSGASPVSPSRRSRFIAILEAEPLWEELLAKQPEELAALIDYSCQSTHFSALFEFLLQYTARSRAPRASLFRPLEVWRLSPSQFSRLRAAASEESFFCEAFQTSPLLAGLVKLSSEVAELRISVEEAQKHQTPQWIRKEDGQEQPGIVSYLCGLDRAKAADRGRPLVQPFVSIYSNSWLSREGSALYDWLCGSEAEVDVGEGEWIEIRFKDDIRAQFSDICVRFGGTAPVQCDPPRRVGWRLELLSGRGGGRAADATRRFDFVHEVKEDESTAERHLGGGVDCYGLRFTATTPFVAIVRIEVFGFVSLPQEHQARGAT